MVGRAFLTRAEPGITLPAFERIAPPPPPDLVAARIDAHSGPGEIVVDLHGRGGWVARSAVDRQRRAFTLEANPLTRLLAEIVLRPPDVRHLDAAFQALSASPHGETSLRLWIGDMFATHCATCGRSLVLDEMAWERSEDEERPVRRFYRCTLCRDQQGGGEARQATLESEDLQRARANVGGAEVRRRLRERFPVPDEAPDLGDAILGLHTDRQLAGLEAILERVEGDLRASPVESGLRLAFLHAVLPASRLNAGQGRVGGVRIGGGRVKSTLPETWRERNPWLAFEDGYRHVRGFVQRLEGAALGPLQARLGTDLRSLAEGAATAVVRVMTPGALSAIADEADPGRDPGRSSGIRPKVRLVLGQPPARFSQERLAQAYHGAAWALGREAAALLPLEALAGPAIRAPWAWQAAALRRSLEAVSPHLAADARVVLLLESGAPEALVAAALGGIGAGYRLLDARLGEPEDEHGGVVELLPPGGAMPSGPRSRANVTLDSMPGDAGDSGLVPGRGLFAAPERIDARPFSQIEAARSVTDTAVEVLKARGEPARYERLLGEILVGLDRTGQLRRLVAGEVRWGDEAVAEPDDAAGGGPEGPPDLEDEILPGGSASRTPGGPRFGGGARSGRGFRTFATGGYAPPARQPAAPARSGGQPSSDPVERVLALVRDELARPTQRRLVEIEAGRWWLADKAERDTAAVPLSDRVEWAVYGLLSTAGPLSESAFFERVAAMFGGHDLPDEALVRTCLASYRSPASTPEGLVTGEDVRRRTAEHTELIARLANGGHRLGMSVWIGRREQGRRLGERLLGDFLDDRERRAFLPGIARAPLEDLEAVDCIWYVRHKAAFLFEVEWTAMLGDVLLRRHARILPDADLYRFLVIAPERTELVRHRLATSPLLRDAVSAGGWQIVKWHHLRAWLASESLELGGLEPYLGLDPLVERSAEQLGMFEPPNALP
jgi:hypothetical protein